MNGVRSYLKKFAYSNASTRDLWNSLAETSGLALLFGFSLEVGKDVAY